MEIKEDHIDQLLQARSEIDEELRRQKTRQTVLFTDIVGSTTYFDRFGDTQGLLLLYRHDALVKSTVEEFQGVVIKTIGDSVMAEFPDPLPAVHAAIAIQRLLMEQNESLARSERLNIRIGIHTGFGFRRANDIFGDIVNVAARVTKSSGPAQILVSRSVMESIPATEVSFNSLGQIPLQGKSDVEELFEVYWAAKDVYDTIRSSSITAVSRRVDGVSPPAPSRTIHEDLKSLQLRLKVSKAYQVVRLRSGQFLAAVQETRAIAVAKPLMILALYGALAAGIVSGRADTKRAATPVSAPVSIPNEAPPVVAAEEVEAEVAEGVSVESSPQVATTSVLKSIVVVPVVPVVPKVEPKPEVPATVSTVEPLVADQGASWLPLIDTVAIPAGVFLMGDDSGKGDEKPRHQVRVDQFHMSRAEITNRQYLAFLMDTDYPRPKDPGFAKNYLMDYPNLPVINVNFDDAMAFCKWASEKFGAEVRLPTEAEWEYAAYAGKSGVAFPWDSLDPINAARFKGNASFGVRTASTDAFPPNSYGLYNMSGNVWEWTLDYYSKDYYVTSPIRNPKGPSSGTKRSIRGGSWADDYSTLRVTRRASRNPGERSDEIGFRVVVLPVNPSQGK